MTTWLEIHNDLEIIGGRRSSRVATKASITQFERARKIKLPTSFREFSTVFGAGELCGWFRFCVPIGRKCNADLETFHSEVYTHREVLRDAVSPASILDNMLFFASTGGGDLFAWRLDQVTNKKDHEYGVFYFPHEARAKRVSQSFEDLFAKCRQGKIGNFEESLEQTYLK